MGKDLNQKLKNFPKLSKLVDVVIGAAMGAQGDPHPNCNTSNDDFVIKMAVDVAVSVCGLACAFTSDRENFKF